LMGSRLGGLGMRILLYGINFAPEPVGIGKYSGELAAWLAAEGHQVRVIRPSPTLRTGN
jgi:colanic acid biosynthesis glycosyl transferase WcaI